MLPHRRFGVARLALLASGERGAAASGPAGAQALCVAIAVVICGGEVLLVCRRDDDSTDFTWQFPAGVIKPGVKAETVTIRETLDDIGMQCAVRQHLETRLHPVTGVLVRALPLRIPRRRGSQH